MKKKSPRGIPDFSRKPSGSSHAPPPDAGAKGKTHGPHSPPPQVKPQSTSAKSGQRGQ